MSIYDSYETDLAKESDGVWRQFEGFRLRIGRAGGGNMRYLQSLAGRRDKFASMSVDELAKDGVMAEVFAEGIIFEKDDPELNLVTRAGAEIAIGSPEMVQALRDLPDFYSAVNRDCHDKELFKPTRAVAEEVGDEAEGDDTVKK